MIVVPNAESLLILAAMIAEDGILDAAKVHLYQNNYTPTTTTALADLTVATFTGYATSTVIAWGDPFVDGDGVPTVVGDVKQFTAGSPLTVPNVIYGYYVTDTGGTVLIFVEKFDTPVAIANAGDAVIVVPAFAAVSQQQ